MTEYCEKTFKTAMTKDVFDGLVKRTCRGPFAVTLDARDVNERPIAIICTVTFTSIEDRDRLTIAMRLASEERAPAAPKPARRAAAGTYAAA